MNRCEIFVYESIDLLPLIEKTKYGTDGFGGIITNGTMFVGYPR